MYRTYLKNWFRRYFEFKSRVVKQIPKGLFCQTKEKICPYYKGSLMQGKCLLLKKEIFDICKECENNKFNLPIELKHVEHTQLQVSWKRLIIEGIILIIISFLILVGVIIYCGHTYNYIK